MPEKAKFIIELDLETLGEMTEIFQRLDIEFDAVEDMVCFPQGGIRQNIITGAGMDEIIANANDHLAEKKENRRLRDGFRQMPPETRWGLMELLAPSADYHAGKELNEIDPWAWNTQAWEAFQRQHPEAVIKA